jgi:hypothetical protein
MSFSVCLVSWLSLVGLGSNVGLPEIMSPCHIDDPNVPTVLASLTLLVPLSLKMYNRKRRDGKFAKMDNNLIAKAVTASSTALTSSFDISLQRGFLQSYAKAQPSLVIMGKGGIISLIVLVLFSVLVEEDNGECWDEWGGGGGGGR